MATKKKPCRVCGKPCTPCRNVKDDLFNWKAVACSPECGKQYFEDIAASRGSTTVAQATQETQEVSASEEEPEPEEELEPSTGTALLERMEALRKAREESENG